MQSDDYDPEANAPTLPPDHRPSGSGWELRELPRRPQDPEGVQRFEDGNRAARSDLDEIDELMAGDWDMN